MNDTRKTNEPETGAVSAARVDPLVIRLQKALNTNDAQMAAVIILTLLNIIALCKRHLDTPIWFILIAVLMWPSIAFISNFFDPLPSQNDDV